MSTTLTVVLIVVAWIVISVLFGLLLGRIISLNDDERDEDGPQR